MPATDNYRAEHQFTAGWIALRFLNDPATALAHFARIAEGAAQSDLARARRLLARPRRRSAGPQRGGAHALRGGGALSDRLLRPDRPRASSACGDIALRAPPEPRAGAAHGSKSCAPIEILYADRRARSGRRDRRRSRRRSIDAGALAALGEVAARHHDARAMLLLGKAALGRGLPLEHYAFPDHRHAELPADRAGGRAAASSMPSRGRKAPSTRRPVSSAKAHGPDAGDAGGRPLHRQEVQRRLRREAPARRPGLQRAARRRRARRR